MKKVAVRIKNASRRPLKRLKWTVAPPLPWFGFAGQAIRRCYDDFYIADCGRPAELRTIRVEKAAVLKRHVEDGVRRDNIHQFLKSAPIVVMTLPSPKTVAASI